MDGIREAAGIRRIGEAIILARDKKELKSIVANRNVATGGVGVYPPTFET